MFRRRITVLASKNLNIAGIIPQHGQTEINNLIDPKFQVPDLRVYGEGRIYDTHCAI
jgi:hypothetical protein